MQGPQRGHVCACVKVISFAGQRESRAGDKMADACRLRTNTASERCSVKSTWNKGVKNTPPRTRMHTRTRTHTHTHTHSLSLSLSLCDNEMCRTTGLACQLTTRVMPRGLATKSKKQLTSSSYDAPKSVSFSRGRCPRGPAFPKQKRGTRIEKRKQ